MRTPFLLMVIISIVCFVLAPIKAKTQSGHGIALIVEDEMISHNDINNRIRMTMATSGIQATDPGSTDKIKSQVIQVIIDEKLYLQEAKRLGIAVTEAELQRAINNLEKQNTLPEGSFHRFIAAKGLEVDLFINQLEAQIAWSKIIASKVRPKVLVSDDEVEEEFERLVSRSSDNFEVNFSEIIVQKKEEETIKETEKRALLIYQELENGADFSALAKERSKGATASSGGKIGWIEESFLIDILRQTLSSLQPAAVSAPFQTDEGFIILKMHGKRKKASPKEQQENMAEIVLHQLYVPHANITSSANEMTLMLKGKRDQLQECSDIETLKQDVPGASKTKPVRITIEELHTEIKPIIRSLAVNTPTDVIHSPMGIHIFMVCERRESKTVAEGIPDKDMIREQMMQRKVLLETRRYLRNLRRNSFIEVRV